MRKLVILGCLGLIAVLAVPATSVALSDGPAMTAKKKKKSYCEKQGKGNKAKLLGKSESFYIYREQGGASVMLCQDKPKFYGSMAWTNGDKLGTLAVVKKKCAFYSALGSSHNPQVYSVNFADFLTKNAQASGYTVGYGQPTGELVKLAVSSNCVAVMATKVNGAPQIVVEGNSAFGYTGVITPPVGDGITDNELASVKIATTSATSATVTWTAAGVPMSYVYAKP